MNDPLDKKESIHDQYMRKAHGPKPVVHTDARKTRRQSVQVKHRKLNTEIARKERELEIARKLIAAQREEITQLKEIGTIEEFAKWEDLLSRLRTVTEDIERYLDITINRMKRVKRDGNDST